MNKQLQADVMLIVVTFGWGASYYLMDVSMEELGPLTLNTYRFLLSFVVLGLIFFPKGRGVTKTTLRYSLYIGVAIFFTYIGATYGVRYTSLTNAGFLCSLAVIFTPLINTLLNKKMPDKKFRIVVLLSVVGIGLLTLDGRFAFSWGDLLCIGCALAYAVDTIITEKAVRKEEVNPFQIGLFQLLIAGVLFLFSSLMWETPTLPQTPFVWFSVIFLALFCTGIPFIIQPIAQQYTSSNHVGVIFTLEPVFAGMVAYFLAGEILSPRAYVGAGLLIFSLLLMEVSLTGKKDRNE